MRHDDPLSRMATYEEAYAKETYDEIGVRLYGRPNVGAPGTTYVPGAQDHGRDHPDRRHDLADSGPVGWPILDEAALHGPVGRYAVEADPHTEADKAGVLVSALVGAGCAMNRRPHMLAGNDQHSAALFAAVVGKTSWGGKGTSMAVARAVLEVADPDLMASRVLSGFGSGEAVVDAVRDAGEDDEGASDTRLLMYEPEMARMLKAASREGSILSMTIRDGWDGRRLQVRSRTKTSVASCHHIGVVAHITVEELRARLTDTETYGGFANRFLWVCVQRSKRLPSGGNVPQEVVEHHGQRIGAAIRAARRLHRVHRSPEGELRWAEVYNALADDDPGGLLGAVTARSAPQVLRCRDSAAYIFGDALGDEVADRLLVAIRGAGERGLDGAEQSKVFGRHLRAARLNEARRYLEERGLIESRTEETGGRPRIVSFAKNANQAKEGQG